MGITNMDNEEERQAFESCPIKGQRAVNPIIEWSDKEIWDYIESENIHTNPLYNQGYDRIGCIGCPLKYENIRLYDFERYPKYKESYIRAFDKMLQRNRSRGKQNFTFGSTGQQVFDWWINGRTH